MSIMDRLRKIIVTWVAKQWRDAGGFNNEDEMLAEEMRAEAAEYLRRQRAYAEQPQSWARQEEGPMPADRDWSRRSVDFSHSTSWRVEAVIEITLKYTDDERVQFKVKNPSNEHTLEVKLGPRSKVMVIDAGKTRTRTLTLRDRYQEISYRHQ